MIRFNLSAQSSEKIDSLNYRLNFAVGQERSVIFNDLAKEYFETDPELALDYSEKAYTAAVRSNDKGQKGISLHNIADAYMYMENFKSAEEYYQKCFEFYKKDKNKEGMGLAYNSLGKLFWKLSDYNEALNYYFKSLKIREKGRSQEDIANTLSNISVVLQRFKHFR